MLDIFDNDAFSVTRLTDAVNELEYVPSRLRELGLFRETPVDVTTITIEQKAGELSLIAPTPRGSPGETRDHGKRKIRSFPVLHFQRDWGVNADEVQGIRQFGDETALEQVQGKVAEKMGDHLQDFDLTEEHARLGAVTGIITYANGETTNLFSAFGVSQPAEVNFDLQASDPEDGILRQKCANIIRATRGAVKGTPFASVHAMVGSGFFDALLKHREVRDTYKGWNEAQILRDGYVGRNRGSNPIFEFGDIVWEEYSDVADAGIGISDPKAHFFPIGVPNMFRTYYAPADYIETVNTRGRRLYSKQWTRQNGKGVDGEMQMNSLHLCTRPKALLRAKATA